MAKYKEEYSILNDAGEPIGPPQVFEADTKEELLAKIVASNKNISKKWYEMKRADKLGLLRDNKPDDAIAIQSFEERSLSADERVRIASELKGSDADAALTRWIEAKFGAPIDSIRENLREVETNKYIRFVDEQVSAFKTDHPEYIESEYNRDTLTKYLAKQKWSITKKNLELAYADLLESDQLVTRKAIEVPPVSAATETVVPAPAVQTEITAVPTVTAPISEVSTVVRPTVSSSGLRRSDSSVGAAPTTIKTAGITIQEVNAMSADDYAKRLREDPTFKTQIESLFTPAKK